MFTRAFIGTAGPAGGDDADDGVTRQPHSFTEPKMTLDAARANLEWFDRFMLGRTPAPSTR